MSSGFHHSGNPHVCSGVWIKLICSWILWGRQNLDCWALQTYHSMVLTMLAFLQDEFKPHLSPALKASYKQNFNPLCWDLKWPLEISWLHHYSLRHLEEGGWCRNILNISICIFSLRIKSEPFSFRGIHTFWESLCPLKILCDHTELAHSCRLQRSSCSSRPSWVCPWSSQLPQSPQLSWTMSCWSRAGRSSSGHWLLWPSLDDTGSSGVRYRLDFWASEDPFPTATLMSNLNMLVYACFSHHLPVLFLGLQCP